jgi:hypothetical protein
MVVSLRVNSLFDRLDQNVENGAIQEIQRVDDGQESQHIVAPVGRPQRCVCFRSDARREIDHGFPQPFFF